MPDTNDYLSQLLARVDKKLNEGEGGEKASPAPETTEPAEPRIFTSGGRFDDVPFSDHSAEQTETAVTASAADPAPDQEVFSFEPLRQEELDDAEEDPEDDDPEEIPGDLEKTDKKTFSFAPDSETADQPRDESRHEAENVFDWNVSEDVEKYLSSGDGSTIFDKMTVSSEKKTGRAIRAEKRMLKENTRQLMDRNSGAKRGCFGTFFHIILVILLVAFTILAVLYVLQTIAGVTIIDINSILTAAAAAITDLIDSFKK